MRRNFRINKRLQVKHIKSQIKCENLKFACYESVESIELVKLKNKLNKTKTKLDEHYELTKIDLQYSKLWLKFQNIIDIYKPMRREIEKKYNAKHVSNAWMKYYEIYTEFDLISNNQTTKYIAFFNAELPGAALCAFNHFMKTQRVDINFEWYGSSYISDNSSTFGDTYGLYANNKNNWLMDNSNSGDMTCIDNILNLANKIGPESPIGGVNFYSHDAGMDVSSDFNNQEIINAKLHLGCALAGFLTMRTGGNFIAKQYTFFETISWNLIMIYSQLFDEFYICKPLTSRPYNSEIYLIGKGFKGISNEIKLLLIDKLINFNTIPLIHQPIDAQLFEFAETVFNQQIDFINENIELLDKYKNNIWELNRQIEVSRIKSINNWLNIYPVYKITNDKQLNTYCK